MGSARNVVCNFPIVAWKRVMFRPLLALAIARLRGRRVILIQHEWAGLHWLRRISYIPALLLADTDRDVLAAGAARTRRRSRGRPDRGKCVLAPLPPNIEAPAETADSQMAAAARRRARRRTAGDRPFRIDLSGQAAERAARHLRDPAATRAASRCWSMSDRSSAAPTRSRKSFTPAPPNSASPTTSSSAAMSRRTTKCSECSARSTPSVIRSKKASPRGAAAFSPACSPAGR